MKNIIAYVSNSGRIGTDNPIVLTLDSGAKVEAFKSSADGIIYALNRQTKRAYSYTVDKNGEAHGKQMTAPAYEAQCKALKARQQAAAAKAEREQIAKYRREHGEATAEAGRAKETNATEPDKFPSMDDIALRREERWISTPEKHFIWALGSLINVRMVEKPDTRDSSGAIIAEKYLEDGGYRFTFEEVRSENGKAVPTGKEYKFFLKADQGTVDSFKRAVNKRYDGFIWRKLNEGVESKFDLKKVVTVDLGIFFTYLVQFPIKALYDYTEWVDKDTNEHRRSKSPKLRLWLPGDADNATYEWHNPKAAD